MQYSVDGRVLLDDSLDIIAKQDNDVKRFFNIIFLFSNFRFQTKKRHTIYSVYLKIISYFVFFTTVFDKKPYEIDFYIYNSSITVYNIAG